MAAPDVLSKHREDFTGRIQRLALPLANDADLDPLLDRICDARCVLLGEASHGTSEYYSWRARISRRLIEEKGFSFIGVEGDWPDCYCINRYIKAYSECGASAREVLYDFDCWPTWMWANEEVVELVEWLRNHNGRCRADKRVGFYGLDVYSLWDSLNAVLRYLERHDGAALTAARRAFHCFEPFHGDIHGYARAANALVPSPCAGDVAAMLQAMRSEAVPADPEDREARFVANQNALVVRGAEAYYRSMVDGGPDSWNLRDTHMADTLDRLLEWHGPDAKAIVWEHNTHVGDARATSMVDSGMVNVGQLARERHGADGVFIVGFGSYCGSVIAAPEWDAPMRVMQVPQARPGSWESLLHQIAPANSLLLLGEARDDREIAHNRGHRAIGVVYHPEYERFGNYVATSLPNRYDAFIFLDQTAALRPLHTVVEDAGEPPETYPWNV